MSLKPFGHFQCILGNPFTPQTQRLRPQDELLCIEGRHARTQVTQDLDSDADDKRQRTKSIVELQSVVPWSRVVELRESLCVGCPIELTRVDNYPTDRGAMATNPFSGTVDNDV